MIKFTVFVIAALALAAVLMIGGSVLWIALLFLTHSDTADILTIILVAASKITVWQGIAIAALMLGVWFMFTVTTAQKAGCGCLHSLKDRAPERPQPPPPSSMPDDWPTNKLWTGRT
jgi:hypothetical protein